MGGTRPLRVLADGRRVVGHRHGRGLGRGPEVVSELRRGGPTATGGTPHGVEPSLAGGRLDPAAMGPPVVSLALPRSAGLVPRAMSWRPSECQGLRRRPQARGTWGETLSMSSVTSRAPGAIGHR